MLLAPPVNRSVLTFAISAFVHEKRLSEIAAPDPRLIVLLARLGDLFI